MSSEKIQRQPAEQLYAQELEQLAASDQHPRPPGWRLSPLAVERFILGDPTAGITPKFVAPRAVVTRVVISLATQRGAMLVGEPGTAKSWLSELLCAAISGDSTLVVQGGAVTRVQELLYSWNEALLKQRGPCEEALIPGPLLRGMTRGKLVRFEELARCDSGLQDALLSILSERVVNVPELAGESGQLFAREGFNLVGTANTADRGVDTMSAALKRRLNFETIKPIANIEDELAVVIRESGKLLAASGVDTEPDPDILHVLVTIFHELRNGQSLDGRSTDRLSSSVMSTAEAVAVAHALGVNAYYYRQGEMLAEDFVRFLVGAAIKDNPADLKRMNHYFDSEVALKTGELWQGIYRHWQTQSRP